MLPRRSFLFPFWVLRPTTTTTNPSKASTADCDGSNGSMRGEEATTSTRIPHAILPACDIALLPFMKLLGGGSVRLFGVVLDRKLSSLPGSCCVRKLIGGRRPVGVPGNALSDPPTACVGV